ncbi:hypothetical protein C1Y63_09070 [Corynebacterium sp. 13CS0277]|uniref:hypothetical protein n=1 Tax=Corynebacterium sp. 13CS0277 TaxID=2071994 RepID=UPI000D03F59D|nr:hypothetical protein [Corynebacterium sp. 13CS0277]PRQ10884.1 hypothetical protein C1Y63_09070 [Corynebacterium sp. 13CS0277]
MTTPRRHHRAHPTLRPALGAALLSSTLLSGCAASPADHAATADDVPAATAAAPRTTATPRPDIPFHEQVDYERLPQGFVWNDTTMDLFNPCTDDLVAHYEELGLEIFTYAPVDVDFISDVSWSCIAVDFDRDIGENTQVLGEPISRERILERLPENFLGDATDSWVPGAYYLDYDWTRTQHDNCQIAVDTPRGRVGVTHYGIPDASRRSEHCQLAKTTFEMLFQDEVFLRALYGDNIPLKHR